MRSPPSTEPTRPVSDKSRKAPYRSPRLEILGSLRKVTSGSGGKGSDGAGGMTMMSDRRAKRDIVQIGQHALGLAIYRFRYLPRYARRYGASRKVGFMADEVALRYPGAVRRDPEGFLHVDYGCLLGAGSAAASVSRSPECGKVRSSGHAADRTLRRCD